MPVAASRAVRDNVASGVVVAQQVGSAGLATMVRAAFVHGMDVLLATSGGIAVVAAVLALAFLPNRDRTPPAATDGSATVDETETPTGRSWPSGPGIRTGQT
jgi:hypothetical protein